MIKVFFRVIFPVFLGILIYVFFRIPNYRILKQLNIDGTEQLIKNYNLPDWFVYNLPDALWLIGFGSLIFIIWEYEFKKLNIIWFFIPLICAFTLEIAQYYSILDGTFDFMDLLFYLFGFITIIIVNIKKLKLKIKKND